jgi:hypothetical protein
MNLAERLSKWWKGLRDSEWQVLAALRSVYQLLSGAPELASALLDRLPIIIDKIKEIERLLPAGSGQRKLVEFVAWIEDEHGEALKKVASVTEIYVAARAIATLLVQVFNAAGLFRKET